MSPHIVTINGHPCEIFSDSPTEASAHERAVAEKIMGDMFAGLENTNIQVDSDSIIASEAELNGRLPEGYRQELIEEIYAMWSSANVRDDSKERL